MKNGSMDNVIEIKTLLKLNKLHPLEKLSQDKIDILVNNNLLNCYKKLTLNNLVVKITHSNRKTVKDWWSKQDYPDASFSINAYYGIVDNNYYARMDLPRNVRILTSEEFNNVFLDF